MPASPNLNKNTFVAFTLVGVMHMKQKYRIFGCRQFENKLADAGVNTL